MVLLKLSKMKKIAIIILILIGITSCSTYNFSSIPIRISNVNIGMIKDDFILKYGQPFTFKIYSNNNDTIEELSYKTPKSVANCEFIVTTKCIFRSNRLIEIKQKDFFVPNNAIFCDSTEIFLKK